MLVTAVIASVALLHLRFRLLEMLLWTKPPGRRTFGLTAEFAQPSKARAANQGLYNDFLVAGLVGGLSLGAAGFRVKAFFGLHAGCRLFWRVFGEPEHFLASGSSRCAWAGVAAGRNTDSGGRHECCSRGASGAPPTHPGAPATSFGYADYVSLKVPPPS